MSRSFLPQSGDQFGGLDINTANLKPERFDNLELGLKWEPVEGLLATAAIYQLDRKNTRAVDPADPTKFILTGEQRSRGLELGLERNITNRWNVSAGLRLAGCEDYQDHDRRPGRAQSALGPAPQLFGVESLRFHPLDWCRPRLYRPLEKLCLDQQCGDPARLCAGRRRNLL